MPGASGADRLLSGIGQRRQPAGGLTAGESMAEWMGGLRGSQRGAPGGGSGHMRAEM